VADSLKREWAYDLNEIDPTKVLPGCARDATWRCAKHGTFSQRISARTKRGAGCPRCAEERRAKAKRQRVSEQKVTARKVATVARGPVRPPFAPMVAPLDLEANTFTVRQAAQSLGCSVQTIRNWIHAGRLYAISTGEPDKPTLRIPASEIPRVFPFVQPKDGGGDKAA
jgi:excisionase family DNA binding protein